MTHFECRECGAIGDTSDEMLANVARTDVYSAYCPECGGRRMFDLVDPDAI